MKAYARRSPRISEKSAASCWVRLDPVRENAEKMQSNVPCMFMEGAVRKSCNEVATATAIAPLRFRLGVTLLLSCLVEKLGCLIVLYGTVCPCFRESARFRPKSKKFTIAMDSRCLSRLNGCALRDPWIADLQRPASTVELHGSVGDFQAVKPRTAKHSLSCIFFDPP